MIDVVVKKESVLIEKLKMQEIFYIFFWLHTPHTEDRWEV